MYPILILSKCMQNPSQGCWNATMRIVRHLKGSLGQGILMPSYNPLQLRVYYDSSWKVFPCPQIYYKISN